MGTSTATDLLALLAYAKEQVTDLNKVHDEASMLYHSVEEDEKALFEQNMAESKVYLERWNDYTEKLKRQVEERIKTVLKEE